MSELHGQILAVARQLFIQRGYHRLSMREIAESLGVSKAALYYYFKDKEQLLLVILKSSLDEVGKSLDRIRKEHNSCREAIQVMIGEILSQPFEQRAVIRLASQELDQLSKPARQSLMEVYQHLFLDKIRAILSDGMKRGEIKHADPELLSWALLGMMYPYYFPAHSAKRPAYHDVASHLASIFLDGVATR